jgi:WD40 repeat protein
VFMRLAGESADGAVERRRVLLAEFETGDEDAARVVALLTDQRLLTATAGSVEVAHEALLREWPRLRQWIEEDREGLRIHRRMTAAAEEWRRLDRDDDALYRGTPLTEALEWRASRKPNLNQLEREFLDAGAARRKRVRAARRRRIELAFAALAVALAAITVVAVVALNQRRDAVQERNVAVSRELALQSGNALDTDPELAVSLALLALDKSHTAQADAALRQATLAFHQLAVLQADSLTARTAAYSPDGTRVVTGGDRGIVRLWEVATKHMIRAVPGRHGQVLAARYSPQGRTIALGFSDGTVALTDASLGAPHDLLRVKGQKVNSVAFSRDGTRLAAGLGDGTVRVLATDGSREAQTLNGQRGPVRGVDFSPDGSHVVSASEDGSVLLRSVGDDGASKVVHTGGSTQSDVEFSPDGRLILGVGYDGFARLWDARTGAQQTRIKGGDRELLAAAFSPNGQRFAVGGADGVTRVWSTAGGDPPIAILRGQRAQVFDVGFSPRGDHVVTAGDDGTARIWDVGQTTSWLAPERTYNISFSPDGRFIAGGIDDGTVRVWDANSGRLRHSLPGPAGFTTGRFSPTANELVVARDPRSSVLVWSLSSGVAKVVARLQKGRGLNVARFDTTGRRIVFADTKGAIAVLDVRSGHEISLNGAPKDVWDVRASPDGNQVVAGPESGRLLIWRLDRPDRPERVLTGHHGHITALDYSRDGRIVSAAADRTIRVWNPRGGPPVVLRGPTDEITGAIFTRDGTRVLNSSADGTVRLWDARGGDALAVLESDGGPIYDIAQSHDGRIATFGAGGVVRVFRCEVCGSLAEVVALARSRAPRPLTPQERTQFLSAAR